MRNEKMAKVRDHMSQPPITISTVAIVHEAAQKMRSADVGALVVLEDGKPYGIVTDRDIAIRGVAQGLNPQTTPIGSICSKDLISVSPEDNLDSVLRLMREKALRRVLVVDYEKAPVGIVSLGDLALERDRSSVLAEISAAPPNH
jgi:CBS domain-containing protein